ncbi:MAG: hypothetical protein HYY78_23795 [Betaproteobacteria bacterium]|nr:hypothetical protein [Betaproteobacteria bacterium]
MIRVRRGKTLFVTLLIALAQEAGAAGVYAADFFVREDIVTEPAPEKFSVCHGGTCEIVSQARLDEAQWRLIAAVFAAPAASAQEERARIAEAIARFETVVGAIADTSDDRAGNRHGENWRSQMDCIDESTNSTTYLRILAGAGLLRWHRVEARVTRGFFLFGWPHTTAVVSEASTGVKWAVDSWFHDNGQPPEIVPLDLWKTGWRPAKAPPTGATRNRQD